ncbi:VRR-NUC domain-containing protein [Xenorhabdus bovienii]|uniref:VRR-NUC domain-containing protein n=1 Tax=Xenorhabdus bovienii TaxID=40576 RepID=UPI0023B2F42C|nr:VRR-NUC domain-containing protein [Xenorhabdus bovienii]MDE9429872.1 VRR-NUC domain-containing protein [Xenorhabdus bovienii]MDE9487537.1 VRR-NUC domain-containing protein [Xenorhabdus bovienii]
MNGKTTLTPGGICPAIPSVTCTIEGAQFPVNETPCYLAQKAAYAIWAPRVVYTKDGAKRSLKQLVMSSLIRKEEVHHRWLWSYKAEVVFAMRGKRPALPMLSTSKADDPEYKDNLPQSINVFARPSAENTAKFKVIRIRRPDIILVKNKQIRWPGLAGIYFDGSKHSDNLKRLIEVKFPGDILSEKQEIDYKQISTTARFCVLHVRDNRDNKEWESQAAEAKALEWAKILQHSSQFSRLPPLIQSDTPSNSNAPIPDMPMPMQDGIQRLLLEYVPLVSEKAWQYKPILSMWLALNTVPERLSLLYASEPKPTSSFWEKSIEYAGMPITWIVDGYAYTKNAVVRGWEVTWDMAENGLSYVSDKTRAALNSCGAWFKNTGKWVVNEIIDPVTKTVSYSIDWICQKTNEVFHLTKETLIETWHTVREYTDISLEALKQVDWVQISADMGNGLVEVVVGFGEFMRTYIVPILAVAAITLLCAIVVILAAPVEAGAAVAAGISSLAVLIWTTLEDATPENTI